LKQILNYNGEEPKQGEDNIAILTAAERSVWAETRNKHFASGINKESLDIIEKVWYGVIR
jgi:Choline/Carnitine o-acyltransferase.